VVSMSTRAKRMDGKSPHYLTLLAIFESPE